MDALIIKNLFKIRQLQCRNTLPEVYQPRTMRLVPRHFLYSASYRVVTVSPALERWNEKLQLSV